MHQSKGFYVQLNSLSYLVQGVQLTKE